jgi:hypothetical protein
VRCAIVDFRMPIRKVQRLQRNATFSGFFESKNAENVGISLQTLHSSSFGNRKSTIGDHAFA